ncbi:sensor histidine kinase [Croceivirga sp. JEA036]|uniref:sensor histidine kinase n=1 Tax=Croceivirga sp. JEA036 TaxID=2721162 RepID=UPI00143A1420|nr:ATP-binding protein [Croceivirga sp. JEA036]NJB36309.1 GHKL domain-containing protein [Croceivirga sp. JEA036]
MHSLLKRQIRKFLPEQFKDAKELEAFLAAIASSYEDYDDKLAMIQRATALSSKELYVANQRLNKETDRQQSILDALSKVIKEMDQNTIQLLDEDVFDPQKLAENIEKQTKRIIEISGEKAILLENLERKNESLNNYAHMVSHDLKSPIRNVHSLVGWIYDDASQETKASFGPSFDLIFQNLTKMDGLIDGILKHATIDSSEEHVRDINLNKLLFEIKQTIYVPDNVTITIAPDLPVLKADTYRLEQLFKNLFTNAIAALEGEVNGLIAVSAEELPAHYKFTVSDNGKGIPEHLQEGIFTMFKKLENDATATGIGLALVKKIINYYKGEIWLSSNEGEGTQFYFTLAK